MVISLELSKLERKRVPWLALASERNQRLPQMKSDDIRTIFAVYQIWLTQERERVAANLREVCKAGQTKR
jgi:hypothetical protein